MSENHCGIECEAVGPVYLDQEKKAKTVLPEGVGSCMETSLKYMFRKVRGYYPLKLIFCQSGICVVYLAFRKLYKKHNISFVKLNS